MPKKGINSPKGIYLLGYDPIGKQFKVLCLSMNNSPYSSPNRLILTLECGKRLWRRLEPEFNFMENSGGVVGDDICINGVLYFEGRLEGYFVIVCFDVRSEKFSFINKDMLAMPFGFSGFLFNYKGKLGLHRPVGRKLVLLYLEDAGNHKWSKHSYVLSPLEENILKITSLLE
ncbi:unnamed protein product [Brassica oleracea var. botrytis]|uniref:(rape) hypothetical protein n=1 Tax=Brassica napus TaxID=3708 RepID=A0A816ITQ2_BRANA|nr:unnamed protein product [Brassica napus]